MFKMNKIFKKQLKYLKIHKKRPFILIMSLQRFVSVIVELICGEFKIWVVIDKNTKKREIKKILWRDVIEVKGPFLRILGIFYSF